ncbi:MAG: SAM-dependent methyltransferase [Gammaproteobacteria bacterium]|jgi:SAM-dependent methyltransferase
MNKHIDKWNARYAGKQRVWSAEPNASVAAELQDLPAGKALDLGCGEGRNAIWLARAGWQVTAIDFSAVAIGKARTLAAHYGVDVDWAVSDVCDYPMPDGGFDLVLMSFLHTDSAERARWLDRAGNAVAPGGVFFYVGHDRSNIEHGHGGPQMPEVLLTAQDICARLDGFEIEKATVVEREVRSEPGHGAADVGAREKALDTLVRAVKRCAA